ncbi:MAG: LysR family transcriptional regulator [Roseovarius sp.]
MSVNPPRPKGPALNALRAFEAAARLGGFANAADELGVSPGAISQHVKSLEDWLGAPLFLRRSQGVQLSEFGASVAPQLGVAFDAMGDAVHRMRTLSGHQTVHIAALPSVAQLWLSPRLPAIRAALPEVSISVSALETPPNLARGMFDLSLFLRPVTGDAAEIVLADDVIYPVCAPHMADALRDPGDLAQQPLIHDALWARDWVIWADAVLGDATGFDRGARHSLYAIALEEARNGAGVLMGHDALVRPSLTQGTLVAPFDMPVRTGLSLVLETPRRGAPSPVLKTVISGLRQHPPQGQTL